MIHPNMATTLNFITTDCAASPEMLQKALSEIVKVTYNCLSVDGDQSTNDTCMLISSGLAGNAEITSENADFETFKNALYQVMKNLTIMLAKDGEGATKLITCVCGSAPDRHYCGEKRYMLSSVQVRYVRRGRQLGTYPLRHRLCGGGFRHQHGGR